MTTIETFSRCPWEDDDLDSRHYRLIIGDPVVPTMNSMASVISGTRTGGAGPRTGMSQDSDSDRGSLVTAESDIGRTFNTTECQGSVAVHVASTEEPDIGIVTSKEHNIKDGIQIRLHHRATGSKLLLVADCWHRPLSNLWRPYWEIRASTSSIGTCWTDHYAILRRWEHPQWLPSKRLWRSAIPDNQMRDHLLTVALRTLRRVVSTQTSMIVNEAVKHGLRWVTLEALARLSGELDSEIEKLTVRTSCRRDASRLSGRKRY